MHPGDLGHMNICRPEAFIDFSGAPEARTWVLVINYEFKDVQGLERREGHEHDLVNLKNIFEGFSDVTYKEASPPSSEIKNLLGEQGIKKLFLDDPSDERSCQVAVPPKLFLLFILSHGKANGIILTDKILQEPLDYFTTADVWESWDENEFLEDCLKVNYFGPCRNDSETYPGKNATRIILFQERKNVIDFFATVESIGAHRDSTNGTLLVQAFCQTLKSLERDVNFAELHRRMRMKISHSPVMNGMQTGQTYVYPHCTDAAIVKKWSRAQNSNEGVAGGLKNLVTSETSQFFVMPNNKSRLVLVFTDDCKIVQLGIKGSTALSYARKQADYLQSLVSLGLNPIDLKVSSIEEILKNVADHGLFNNEGFLFITIFAEVVLSQINNALAIAFTKNDVKHIVEVGALLAKFTDVKFAKIPKVFFIISHTHCIEKEIFEQVTIPAEVNTQASYSEFLLFIGSDNLCCRHKLASVIGQFQLRAGMIYLEDLWEHGLFQSSAKKMVWSTTTSILTLKSNEAYIPHSFKGIENIPLSFRSMLTKIMERNESIMLISATPGSGKSRCSEEIYLHLVVEMPDHLSIYLKLSHSLIKKLNSVEHGSEYDLVHPNILFTEVAFVELTKIVDFNSQRKNQLRTKLGSKEVFVIMDGFDEICPYERDRVLRLIKILKEAEVKILVTSRPHERANISSVVGDVKEYSLEPFDRCEKILLLKHMLFFEDEKECGKILDRFENAIDNFTSNPLLLKMIGAAFNRHRELRDIDLFSIYEEFVKIEIEGGIQKALLLQPPAPGFYTQVNLAYQALTKGALFFFMRAANIENIVVDLTPEEKESINFSGIASVLESQLTFEHKTLAEFLIARYFLHKHCFPLKEYDGNVGIELDLNLLREEFNFQLSKFIDNGAAKFKGKLTKEARNFLATKLIFKMCCEIGMESLFVSVFEIGNQIDENVMLWLVEEEADYAKGELGAYFMACCSSELISMKLFSICPEYEVENVRLILSLIVSRNGSKDNLVRALKKMKNWRELWPKSEEDINFLFLNADCIRFIDYRVYEGALSLCDNFDEEILLKSIENKQKVPTLESLKILVEKGFDLTRELNGKNLMTQTFLTTNRNHEIFEHLIRFWKMTFSEILQHFAECREKSNSPDNLKKTLHFSKSINAMSPNNTDLGIEHKNNYFDYIVERVEGLVSLKYCQEGETNRSRRCSGDFKLPERKMSIYQNMQRDLCLDKFDERTQALWDKWFLYLLHLQADNLEAFNLDLEKCIIPTIERLDKNFKYECGCSLVPIVCYRGYMSLLQEMAKREFSFDELENKNEWGQTFLHLAVQLHSDHYELAKWIVDIITKKRVEQVDFVRSLLSQRDICAALLVPDNVGKTPLHYALYWYGGNHESMSHRTAIMLMENALGDYFVNQEGITKISFLLRSDEELEFVRDVLCSPDSEGNSCLSLSFCYAERDSAKMYSFILSNLQAPAQNIT